jgi:hypothetical protein
MSHFMGALYFAPPIRLIIHCLLRKGSLGLSCLRVRKTNTLPVWSLRRTRCPGKEPGLKRAIISQRSIWQKYKCLVILIEPHSTLTPGTKSMSFFMKIRTKRVRFTDHLSLATLVIRYVFLYFPHLSIQILPRSRFPHPMDA